MVWSLFVAMTLAAAPEVALLTSREGMTELRFQRVGDAALAPAVARVSHAPGETVRGAVLPGTRAVLASVVLGGLKDLSFASALYRLEAGQPARALVDRVALAHAPVVTAEGRVFVSRGVAGPPAPGSYRVDALTVEEVDAATGATRVVHRAQGLAAVAVGALGREVLVYEVLPERARLIAVHADSLAVRVLLPELEPLARDFVVDAPRRRLLFTQGTAGRDEWHVVAVELDTGRLSRLAQGPSVALLPTVFPSGEVAYAPAAGRGLVAAQTDSPRLRAQGPGFERVRAFAAGLAVGLHEVPSEFARPFAVRLADGAALAVAAPPGSLVEIGGVLP